MPRKRWVNCANLGAQGKTSLTVLNSWIFKLISKSLILINNTFSIESVHSNTVMSRCEGKAKIRVEVPGQNLPDSIFIAEKCWLAFLPLGVIALILLY
jgi:hypothetical protein